MKTWVSNRHRTMPKLVFSCLWSSPMSRNHKRWHEEQIMILLSILPSKKQEVASLYDWGNHFRADVKHECKTVCYEDQVLRSCDLHQDNIRYTPFLFTWLDILVKVAKCWNVRLICNDLLFTLDGCFSTTIRTTGPQSKSRKFGIGASSFMEKMAELKIITSWENMKHLAT